MGFVKLMLWLRVVLGAGEGAVGWGQYDHGGFLALGAWHVDIARLWPGISLIV